MFFLVYVSSAGTLFTKVELLGLLEKCRENNSKLNITGILLYKDGNFMQILEGEESAVRGLYKKIAADPRHHGTIVLLQGASDRRQFPDWSMAFRNLDSPTGHAAAGYNEFLNTQLTGQEFSEKPTRAQKLLLSFKKNM